MHATTGRIDEWPFEVDSQNLGSKSGIGISRTSDITRDAMQALAGLFRGCRNGGRDERCGTASRYCRRDFPDCLRGAFHHVVAAGAVNVHVDEAGNHDFVSRSVVFRIVGDANLVAVAHLRDLAAFNDDHTVENFFVWREDAAGVNRGRSHGSFMLPELKEKNTSEPCILFLLRYNHGARKFKENRTHESEEFAWHMTSGM